jgi:Zn-dependent peptidase ImmA (M78 family)
MPNIALVTPDLLKWARLTAKYSLEDAAFKLKIDTTKLLDWEEGNKSPTVTQAEKMSKLYKRPLAVFFLPVPPERFETLRDFRKSSRSEDFNTALSFLMREILAKQSWISDFRKEEGELPHEFVGKFSLNDTHEVVATNIRKMLRNDECPRQVDILKYCVEKAESNGIFVSQASYVNSRLLLEIEDVRGFAISDSYAPYIFINSRDSKNAQLFTLIHELAHIWIGESGVSDLNLYSVMGGNALDYETTEYFCNEVAANVLMPKEKIHTSVDGMQNIGINEVDILSDKFRVSSYAMLVRLRNLGLIKFKTFMTLKEQLSDRYKKYVAQSSAKSSSGGPNYNLLTIRKNSKSFSRIIYNLYRGGRISGSEASDLLSIKLNYFSKLKNLLYS